MNISVVDDDGSVDENDRGAITPVNGNPLIPRRFLSNIAPGPTFFQIQQAGNLILSPGAVYFQTPRGQGGDAGVSEAEKAQKVEEFKEKVNQKSVEQSKSSIAGNFDGYVREPKKEVAPVLVRTNFFRGETILEEKNYAVVEEHGRKVTKKKGREVEVRLEDIHKHGRYLILVGGAGSGKTTLIKRYTDMVLKKKVEKLKKVQLVHFVNVRDLSGKKLTPREMLFGKLLPGKHLKEAIKYGYEWMQDEENQPHILLAFDGIDTAPWMLTGDQHEKIDYDDEDTPDSIMFNILRGHLFPKCWLLLTSREYGITRFPRIIRPDNVIALKGLTRPNIEILVMELGGDQGERIWRSLQKKSLNLMLLCSTPLFLVFTVIVYKKCENPPDNLSGIILTLLESHIHSDHSTAKNVREIIDKLKKLSLKGLEEGRVVFNKEDVEEVGLDVKDVKDLVISVPTPSKDGVYKQRIVEEDYSLFFCHQAFQEALAALAVANKPLLFFKKFSKEHLHKPNYVVVKQMLCGILFNLETTRLAEQQAKVKQKEKKQTGLLETLKGELNTKGDSPMDMLNLLISLRECGEEKIVIDMIRNNIPKISLSGIPLTPSDLHAVASVSRHCIKLSIMQLVNCYLDRSGLEVLANRMKGSDVEITVFDVSFNGNLRKDSMADLYEICRRGQGLNYWQCGFRQYDILTFNPKTAQVNSDRIRELPEEEKIEEEFRTNRVLDCSCHNVEKYPACLEKLTSIERAADEKIKITLTEYLEETDTSGLCNILKRCTNIREFGISECEFSQVQLEDIENAIGDEELEALNVFLIHGIGSNGWGVIGSMANRWKVKNLFITACSLTEEKLRKFLRKIKGAKIYKLDISRNENMDKYTMQLLGEIIDGCDVKEVVMGYCKLSGDNMKVLKRALGNAKIIRIDISGNDRMGVNGFEALGEIVYKSGLKQLDVSECDPSPPEIRSFREAAHDSKIAKLNVSRNRNMGVDGLEDVGKLVGQCQLEETFIRQCELEVKTLKGFQRGLGDAKIKFLDFGLYFMKPRKTTEEEVEILAELLNNVTDQLTLNDWDISEKHRRFLQEALNKLPFKGPKILFNRGTNDFICQQVGTPFSESC